MAETIKEDFNNEPKLLYIVDFTEEAVAIIGASVQEAIENKVDTLPIFINSFGGEVENLLAIIDILATFPGKIVTIGVGKAMSAGAFLLACGSEGCRYATPNTSIMIHHLALTGFEGKTQDMEVSALELKKLQARVFSIIDKKCGQKEGFFLNYLRERGNTDIFLTAEEAKELHLIDHIKYPIIKRREILEFV